MFIKKLSIIDYQYKKHRQHVECKPEYDPQYDFTRNLNDKCEHNGANWRCGHETLDSDFCSRDTEDLPKSVLRHISESSFWWQNHKKHKSLR